MTRFARIGVLLLAFTSCGVASQTRVQQLKITVLSTMLADGDELGEWGFAALVEVDGRKILFDTGAKSDVVLRNTQTMKLDLSDVRDVILSHWHDDHVGGFMTLRRAVMKQAPAALARTHVGEGIFASRGFGPARVERNPMIRIKADYEQTNGEFVVHGKPAQIYPGVWLTGPVPRKNSERNWSGNAKMITAKGEVEDTIPDDMSLVIDTPRGLVIVTGCGHAGVVNIIEHARSFVRPIVASREAPTASEVNAGSPRFGQPERVHALIGGIHLFAAREEALAWTTAKLRDFRIEHFIGAHCTGIETVYRFRADLRLDRARCVVGAVGQTFELGKGIDPGAIAK